MAASIITRIRDGYANVVANLGTDRDKASHGGYLFQPMNDYELVNSYRSSWLSRKIVDIIPDDAVRMWRSFDATKEEITKIESEENRLKLKETIRAAMRSARLYGMAAIHFAFDGEDELQLGEPINPEAVKQGSISHLTLIPGARLSYDAIENDPLSEFYGKPGVWILNSAGNAALGRDMQIRIHASRLIILYGQDIPVGGSVIQDEFLGDSALQAVITAVMQADGTVANVASLVFEAKVDVIKVEGLMRDVGDPRYENKLLSRFRLAATGKGNNGTLLLDKDEDYESKSASFATLPDVMDRFFQNVAGAADIPITRLYGMSPGGMNSTGEHDMKNYYDRVRVMQELEIDPAMAIFNDCLLRSAFGNRPADIWHKWNSLWQMSDKEKSEIGKAQVETAAAAITGGLVNTEAMATALTNTLIEHGVFVGLEDAIEEFGLLPDEPTAAEAAAMMLPAPGRTPPARAKPALKVVGDADNSDDPNIGKGKMEKLTPRQKTFWREYLESHGVDPEEFDGALKDYDPGQPRDGNGKWSSAGGTSGAAGTGATGASYASASEGDYQAVANAAKVSRGDQGLTVDIAEGADAYFVADNKMSAFAMRGNDVIGVASHKDNPKKGIRFEVFAKAEEYARDKGFDHLTLDCFEPLPKYYSQNGFKETERMKFNWDYAPDGWTKSHGEPDVVMMRKEI